MKMKNIPVDIKSKSLNEAKSEIADILERLENENIDLENSIKDYERLLSLNRYIDSLFRERLNKIRFTKKEK
jgi:exonuclease VII small subunit|tara:strand:+ start:201 stop:416 length:216 start_codon:yes stop_codon:yes gene_type:complete